ncbi:MAG: FHA domain-containing protein [Anaerolineales bacterium]|nr:FHA domain-containing protein [Anaerolineales bacterium]MCA9928290.1 FHA domain-containing protein [Anaerolineales bacterium]
MSFELFLLLLRLGGAALLLAFLGTIAWLIYQDMRVTSEMISQQGRQQGVLRVLMLNGEAAAPGAQFPLLPVTSLGRSSNNTIVLDDTFASGEHALIVRRDGQWWLEDLGSRNGTLLNDVLLEETAVITTGDIITIGETSLKIEF